MRVVFDYKAAKADAAEIRQRIGGDLRPRVAPDRGRVPGFVPGLKRPAFPPEDLERIPI
jgi:hypothetical protein